MTTHLAVLILETSQPGRIQRMSLVRPTTSKSLRRRKMEGENQEVKLLFSYCHWTQGWEELDLVLTQEVLNIHSCLFFQDNAYFKLWSSLPKTTRGIMLTCPLPPTKPHPKQRLENKTGLDSTTASVGFCIGLKNHCWCNHTWCREPLLSCNPWCTSKWVGNGNMCRLG